MEWAAPALMETAIGLEATGYYSPDDAPAPLE